MSETSEAAANTRPIAKPLGVGLAVVTMRLPDGGAIEAVARDDMPGIFEAIQNGRRRLYRLALSAEGWPTAVDVTDEIVARLGRSKRAAKVRSKENTLRISVAADMTPQQYRAQHKPLPDLRGDTVLKPSEKTVMDANGRIGSPYRTVNTIQALRQRSEITAWAAMAGEHFRDIFDRAHLNPLRAADWGRCGGGVRGDDSVSMIFARNSVDRALTVLGGHGSPAGRVVWDVIGLDMTLQRYSELTIFGSGRSLNQTVAKGILIGALGALAWHYGYDPEARRDAKMAVWVEDQEGA